MKDMLLPKLHMFWDQDPSGGGSDYDSPPEPVSVSDSGTASEQPQQEEKPAPEVPFKESLFGDDQDSATPSPSSVGPQQALPPAQGPTPPWQEPWHNQGSAPFYPQQPQPPAGPELPPIPDEELWSSNPVHAAQIMDQRAKMQTDFVASQHARTIQQLQQSNAALQQQLAYQQQMAQNEERMRAASLITDTKRKLDQRLMGSKKAPGILNSHPKYKENPELQKHVDSMVKNWVNNASSVLSNPRANPHEKRQAMNQLKWAQENDGFINGVIALAEQKMNVQSFEPMTMHGGFQTDGTQHSKPSDFGLSRQDLENAKEAGIDPAEFAKARKFEKESVI